MKGRTARARSEIVHLENTGRSRPFLWLRKALDCLLILLVILIVAGNPPAVRAGVEAQSEGQNAQAAPLPAELANNQPIPALLETNTLAAMIAAENASLTPPIYFIDLPLINR